MLKIEALSLGFVHPKGLLRKIKVPIFSDLSLSLAKGETLAVIGASGVGKSLLAHAILGILPPEAEISGQITLNEHSLLPYPKHLRGKVALIAQDVSHLDPLARVKNHILWAAERAGKEVDLPQWLARLGLSEEVGSLYPAQLSGGMARRVMAIMALVAQPEVLILDEPTVGLDPISRDLLLGLMRDHTAKGGMAMVISHDLAAVVALSDHVALMQEGGLIALERAADFTAKGQGLQNPLSRQMWLALPENGFDHEA